MISLDEALKLALNDNLKKSIGEQSEHTLHRTIKFMIEPNEDYHEKLIDGKIVDIYNGNIYEIQTKFFKKLIDKFEVLLPNYKVCVYFPYIIRNRIIKIDNNGEVIENRLSPKKNKLSNSLLELFYIKNYLLNDNLTIKLLALNCNEIRTIANNRSKKIRIDSIPTEILEEITLYNKEDYIKLLPELSDEFTQNEFAKACGLKQRKACYILYTFEYLGLIKKSHKVGRCQIYKKEIE